ncbi:hypothetical protein ACRRTK_003760 [Alexandromys fortis]
MGEDLLLEVQVRARPDWLLVCHEGWNPALGMHVCQSLGHLRLAQHKAVNLSDIKLTRPWEFAQLSARPGGLLQEAWQPRVWGKTSGFSNSWRSGGGFWALAMASERDAWLPAHVRGLCAGTPLGSDCCPLHVQEVSVCSFRLSRLSSWRVHAGLVSHSAVRQQQGAMVEKIIPHPLYSAQNHDYDVALLQLRTPLNFSDTVGAVCLPAKEQQFPRGSQCWVSGWGHTDPSHTHSSDTLQDTVVPLLSTHLCNSSCVYSGALTHRMLCAGYLDGRADACQVWPIVEGGAGDLLVVEGVVSWGRGCAEPNHPGVYAKVAEFLDWIHDTVQTPMSLGSLAGPLATGEAAATSDAELWISHGSSQTEGQQLQHWPLF